MNGMAGPGGYHEEGSSPDEVEECREKRTLLEKKIFRSLHLPGAFT